ncbi:MAG: hypothetical protein CL670_07225 [Balneola sp.]|jgi:hypothetical protein|nr:hypothetical protein [Balneola sp.]MBE78926.1 hypothetical protein [Balneola sp.]|tara:strand:+ start:50 stop:970 length:921 start_codon:yes stop_codon:yes gene_type:complete
MIFEKPEIFYKEFPYKYWLYKAEMLYKMIGDDESLLHDSDGNLEALGGNEKEFKQMLKYELHFTYYHQAEALFELIFALEKVINDSKYVWLELSNVKSGDMHRFNKKVKQISDGSDRLRDKKVDLTDGRKITFYEWLIFDVFVPELEKTDQQVKTSIEKVDSIIQVAADDLASKKEYNAFKHGMRVLHLFKYFKISDKEQQKFELNFDLSNSFTYINFPKENEEEGTKGGDIQAVTKGYSPKQDLFKIKLITFLMSGIIESRKMRYFGKGKIMEFFEYDILEKLNELRPKTENITYTLHADSYDEN